MLCFSTAFGDLIARVVCGVITSLLHGPVNVDKSVCEQAGRSQLVVETENRSYEILSVGGLLTTLCSDDETTCFSRVLILVLISL